MDTLGLATSLLLLLIFYADPVTRFLNPESSCSPYILGSPSTHLWQKLGKVLQNTFQEGNYTGHIAIIQVFNKFGSQVDKEKVVSLNGHMGLIAINFKIYIEIIFKNRTNYLAIQSRKNLKFPGSALAFSGTGEGVQSFGGFLDVPGLGIHNVTLKIFGGSFRVTLVVDWWFLPNILEMWWGPMKAIYHWVKQDGVVILVGAGGDTWPLFCVIELVWTKRQWEAKNWNLPSGYCSGAFTVQCFHLFTYWHHPKCIWGGDSSWGHPTTILNNQFFFGICPHHVLVGTK